MSREIKRAIVKCLYVDGARVEDVEALASFPDRDWIAVSEWLDMSGLALVFADRLQKMEALDVAPYKVRTNLLNSLIENRRRVTVMKDEFTKLNSAFDRVGVEYAVWKGFALYPDFFPDPCLRPSYDYDYLIEKSCWEDAQKILLSAGYTQRATTESVTHRTFLPTFSSPKSHAGLYSADLARKVELHRSPIDEETAGIPLELEAIAFGKLKKVSWGGLSFPALAAHEAFTYQSIHAFHHVLQNWCRMGWLWEISYFLRRQIEEDREADLTKSSTKLHQTQRDVHAIIVALATKLFGPSLNGPLGESLRLRAPLAIWLDQFGLRGAMDHFSRDKSTLFLYREFVRDDRTWREIRNRQLFPLHRPNRVANARLSGASRPAPSYPKQLTYFLARFVHHSFRGLNYAWESNRWDRLRRLNCNQGID